MINIAIACLAAMGVFMAWGMLGLPAMAPVVIFGHAIGVKLLVAMVVGFHTHKQL
tara:strand:- start:423 stop:587 length:165 start_codon:yes stop_codon:yes gene_type:complete